MRDLIVTTIVFGLIPFVLKRPAWGVYLAAWLGYMNPHRLCWGFAFNMPFVQITAIATMLGMVMTKEKLRMIWSRETILLAILIAWMGVTTTQAFFIHLAVPEYIKFIKIQILTVLAILVLTSRERVHIFIWIICLSLGFFGIKGGIFTIAHGGVYHVQGPTGSFIGGNNELALALIMTIPLMRYLHLQEKRKWLRTGLAGAMLLCALAAVGSQSRGALLGLLVMGTMFWLKSRNKFMTAILIVMAVGMVAAIMPQSWYERMHTIDAYKRDASAEGRINAWWTAYHVANTRVTGGGFMMFQPSVFREYAPQPFNVHDAHSIYFEMIGEHGWIGFSMFMLLLAFTWLKCSSTIRRAKRDPTQTWARDLASMIQVSLLGYMSAGAFLGLAYFDYLYHLVAVTVVVSQLLSQQVAAQPRSKTTATNALRKTPDSLVPANPNRNLSQ